MGICRAARRGATQRTADHEDEHGHLNSFKDVYFGVVGRCGQRQRGVGGAFLLLVDQGAALGQLQDRWASESCYPLPRDRYVYVCTTYLQKGCLETNMYHVSASV